MICSCYVSRMLLSFSSLSDCRNALAYANAMSRNLTKCEISPGSLALPVAEAGDFVELIVLYPCTRSRAIINQKHSL